MNARILFTAAAVAAALSLSRPAAAATLTDGDIAGIVAAANQGEIDAAQTAIGKAQNADVRKFAAHMAKDHSETKTKLANVLSSAGLTVTDTDASNDLKSQAADEAVKLNAARDADFDAVYMETQVADHEALLKKLDEDLLPAVKDPDLSALLHKVRGVVEHHLALARRIQIKTEAKP